MKVFDPVIKLLEEGGKLGELDKLNQLLYGPARVPCVTKGSEEVGESRVKTDILFVQPSRLIFRHIFIWFPDTRRS